MKIMAQFLPVSREHFQEDWGKVFPGQKVPETVRLPERATVGSAGYDFFAPSGFSLQPGQSMLLPTGVRVRMEPGWVLMLFPRSGLGFRYRLQLDNTVGIIDSDYFGADNEGHIMLKLTNDSRTGRVLEVAAGDAVAQGVFLEFGVTVDDGASTFRKGGFGSTDRK